MLKKGRFDSDNFITPKTTVQGQQFDAIDMSKCLKKNVSRMGGKFWFGQTGRFFSGTQCI